ncbi:MAG TPA: hypothetical protein VHM02_10225 [Thermoanaerobaculia bacterium]|nr:hypothetical protein [Thermoanaerobaculia bacterium]
MPEYPDYDPGPDPPAHRDDGTPDDQAQWTGTPPDGEPADDADR